MQSPSRGMITPPITQQCGEIDMNEVEMKTLLAEGVCEVGFTKVNGEFRLMKCTTSPELIPKSVLPKEGSSQSWPDDVIRVYDVVAEGWRSFKSQSVISFDLITKIG